VKKVKALCASLDKTSIITNLQKGENMSQVQLSREKMMELFNELNELLKAKELRGEIVLFGGAVFVLVLKTRPRTKDVDAVWEPKSTINKMAVSLAQKHGLTSDWLNDGVKVWVSGMPTKKVYHQFSNLTIYHADLRYILAMKCLAARQDALDREDVKTLIKILNIKSAEQCLAVLFSFYPQRLVEQKSVYFIEEIFDEIRD
jgi:hypothetical protein